MSYIHGLRGSKFYQVYYSIRRRCNCKKAIDYERYGGRGIKNEWKSFLDFRNDMYYSFLKHVQQFGEKETTIERVDSHKNYCKENCRWATNHEQTINKRNSLNYTLNGKTKNLSEWAKVLGINYWTLHGRKRHGWSIEKILQDKLLTPNRNFGSRKPK